MCNLKQVIENDYQMLTINKFAWNLITTTIKPLMQVTP